MAEIIKISDAIIKLTEKKQRNEQAMLFRLNNLFRGSIPRNRMRKVVLAAFQQMLAEAALSDNLNPALTAALDEARRLAVWHRLKHPANSPKEWLCGMTNQLVLGDRNDPKLDCNDLSELIRVTGEWIEKGGGNRPPNLNKQYRVGVARTETPRDPGMEYLHYLGGLRRKYGWQYSDHLTVEETKELERLAFGDANKAAKKARDAMVWSEDVRQKEKLQQHRAIEDHVRDFWVRPRFEKASGMMMFKASKNDICKKIDLLFGLIIGATISGTTTDTVMVLKNYGSQLRPPLPPGYFLFPVGTITASLHHSLVEAGLALTVTECIDSYCAGFYTTLMPKGGLPGELEDAAGILKESENDPENHHLLIWYDGNEKVPVGCIRWNKPFEIKEYRRLVEGKGLLTHINSMPQVPDKWAIMRLIKTMAPKLFAYLPEELQLR